MKFTKTVCVALPQELYEKLGTLAEESCRTRAGYIRQIIRAYLQEIETDQTRKL